MIGWHISVYRQTDKRTLPATPESPEGKRLAVWQTGLDGLNWISNLVKEGKAIDLGGNGYPCRFTGVAQHLIPRIVDGPAGARNTWISEASDILTDKWEGKTVIDHAEVADCSPVEWLLVEAWDES
jgi:hypothetical protein